MDVRHARISADSHFMRYGNSEDRISSPFLYNPESKFGYRISAFLYILFLANELYLKSSIIHFTLKSLISYIQYLQISNKKFELIVTIPWLSGGVREAFNTYNLREYSSRNYLRLEGLKNVFDSSESPMLLIANNNENSKYLIFFPVQVLTLLSRGNLERPFHIHHAFGNISNFLEFIQIPNYKLYFFVHDYYLFSQLPHLYDEEKLNRISLSAAVQDFPNFKINLNEVIDKIDFFIFPSISVRKNLFNLIPISKQITMYPPEYSDIELTRVSRMSLNPSYKILILGHLGNYKGMRIIRNTILESRRQDLKFKFVHIGKPVFDFKCSNYVNLPDLGRCDADQAALVVSSGQVAPDKLTSASGMVVYKLAQLSYAPPAGVTPNPPGSMAPWPVGYTIITGSSRGVVALQVNADGSLSLELNTTLTDPASLTAFTAAKRIYNR